MTPASKKQEQLEQLIKREDIRTMTKDIARLREQEAQKERERIAKLKTEQDATAEKERQRIAQLKTEQTALKEKQLAEKIKQEALAESLHKEQREKKGIEKIKETIVPSGPESKPLVLPKPPSALEKILIRVLLFLIFFFVLLNLGALAYWAVKKGKIQLQLPPFLPSILQQINIPFLKTSPPQTTIQPKSSPSQPIQQLVPSPFLHVDKTIILLVKQKQTVSSLLRKLIGENTKEGLQRIVLKDETQNKPLDRKEFFETISFSVPPLLAEMLHDDFMLLFSSAAGARGLGFIAPIQPKENISEIVKAWEQTMEKDANSFVSLVGKKGEGYVSFFQTIQHGDTFIRFQALSSQDLGLYYALVDNYLVFSTSSISIKQIIDRLR